MKPLISILIGTLVLFGACANNDKAAPAEKKSEVVSVKPMTKEDASKLAHTHLALKQHNWGQPLSVEEVGDKYFVAFKTPQQELRLIGQRVLIVDKHSGVVTFQKRR
jgi:hypothetical protein